jgi:hypothetical protein
MIIEKTNYTNRQKCDSLSKGSVSTWPWQRTDDNGKIWHSTKATANSAWSGNGDGPVSMVIRDTQGVLRAMPPRKSMNTRFGTMKATAPGVILVTIQRVRLVLIRSILSYPDKEGLSYEL